MNNKEPKISVVVPTYNCAKYLTQAIESVLTQSKPAFEIIVVDDGSTDETASVLAFYKDKISVIHQQNRGVSCARNVGIEAATGDWIAFLDSDDIWFPNKLELYIEAMNCFPNSVVYYSEFTVLQADRKGNYPSINSLNNSSTDISCDSEHSGWIYHQLLLTNWVHTSSALVNKSIFETVGKFDENLIIAEDWDLFLRISRYGQFYKIKQPLSLYRITPNSLTKTIKPINYTKIVLDSAIAKYGYSSPDGQEIDWREFRRRAYVRQYEYGLAAYKNKWYSNCKNSMSGAIKCKPLSIQAWLYLFSATFFTFFNLDKTRS